MEGDALHQDSQLVVIADRLADLLSEDLKRRFRERFVGRTAKNQFGGKGTIKFNPTPDETRQGIREEITVIDWQDPDDQPRAVTLEVGILAAGSASFPQGSSGGVSLGYRSQAFVLLGTPATICDPFLFDLNRGRRLMLSASYIAVTIRMISPPPTYTSGSLQVYGALGLEGSFSGSDLPTTTVYVDSIAPGATVNVATPSRAHTLVDIVNATPTNFTVNLLDTAGRVLRGINTATIGTLGNITYLSGDCTQIGVTNTTSTTQNLELVFGLLM